MKCLLCFIKGHKWWIKSFTQSFDANDRKIEDATHTAITHCDRCGEPNPRMPQPLSSFGDCRSAAQDRDEQPPIALEACMNRNEHGLFCGNHHGHKGDCEYTIKLP